MTKDNKLQIIRADQNGNGYVNKGWTNDNGLTKGLDITNGWRVAILQDDFKNL